MPDQYEQQLAAELLRDDCLRDRGYSVGETIVRRLALEIAPTRRYYYIDPTEAEKFGYGIDPSLLDESVPQGDATAADVQDRQECAEWGYGEVCGSTATGSPSATVDYCEAIATLDQGKAADIYVRASRSEAVVAAAQQWSRCMRAGGYEYRSVVDAWETGSELPMAEQRAQASADMACKLESSYVRAFSAAEASLQRADLERRAQYFESLRSALSRYEGRVDDILRDHGQ